MLNSRNYAVLTAMLSAAGLLPMSAMADISFTEGGERLINTLHTHLYSPSSGLSSSDEIKTAAVCFISDTKNCSDGMFGYGEEVSGGSGSDGAPDYDLNDAERCRKEGYTLTSCAAGETPESFCIYNSNYFARCVCPSGYKTCEPPYYGVGQACGNKYASCEEDTERACKELDSEFTDTCQTGWKVDPNNTCEYDATFGKCCSLCEGYDYTTIPEGYIADGAACVDCNGTSKYKIKINPCDGFQDCGSMGGDTGAKTCMSGSQIKYDNCKPCPNLGTLSSCPSPFTCTYEECSNRYYKSGCKSGYDWNASSKTCTAQCSSDYKYKCTGANQTGGSGTACNGKYVACTCSGGYEWSGSTCTACASSYQYTCNSGYNVIGGNGTSCGGKYSACTCSSPYTWSDGICSCPSSYKYDCKGEGIMGGSGGRCNSKFKRCTCYRDYYMVNATTCMKYKCLTGSQLGYILNSDMTVTSSKQSGKTPIGVVVCSYSGGGGQAMALSSIGTYKWSTESNKVSSLPTYSSYTEASKDNNSCSNTSKIIAAGDKNKYPAAWAAHEYSTEGTSAGDWCLPAGGIFTAYNNYMEIINAGFNQAGGVQIPIQNHTWSSSVGTGSSVFTGYLRFDVGMGMGPPGGTHPVRPVIEF